MKKSVRLQSGEILKSSLLYQIGCLIILKQMDKILNKSDMPERPTCWIEIPFAVHQRPHLRRVLGGIEAYAQKKPEWRLRLMYYYPMTPILHLGERTDGFIGGVPSPEHLAAIKERDVPTVLINCPPEVPDWAGNVGLDFGVLGEKAVAYFLARKVTQLAYFGSLHPERTEHWRFRAGVEAAVAAHGLQLHNFETLPPGLAWQDVAAQQPQWAEWVAALPEGTGIICADDEFAARVYMGASGCGRLIGSELFVLGLGNEEHFCEAMNPPLSSIQVDYFQMGWQAAALLDEQLSGGQRLHRDLAVRYATVITRQSTRPDTHPDPKVQVALTLIWNHVGDGITVDKLARHVKLGRRQLQRLLHAELGHSPSAEIQRARVETAKRLLCEGTAPLAEIADTCGFSDQAHMTRAIRKATGSTPSQFRLIGRRG